MLPVTALWVLLGSGCGGPNFTVESTCKDFLNASPQDQQAAVTTLARQFDKPDFVTPIGAPEVPYYCTANPNNTLRQLFSQPQGGSEARSTSAANTVQRTQALLSPVNGGDARGRALFGRVDKTPILQVRATGLNPSPKGQSYTVWLYHSPTSVLRVGAVDVGRSGAIAAQFPIPTELLAYVASGAFDQIDVSLTNDSAYKAELAKAKQETRLPAYSGTDVLHGRITGPATP